MVMEKQHLTGIGAIVSAFLASLCCIGPVMLALLGLGGAGAFIALETYRPYLIGVTVVLLGTAFYFTYRKREVVCADGRCELHSAGKWAKAALWIATLVIAFFLVFPYFKWSKVLTSQQSTVTSAQRLTTTIVKVKGMSCESCNTAVEIAVKKLNGVHEVKASYEKGEAIVTYDKHKVTLESIAHAISDLGYETDVKSARAF
jgi:copper ion binding protein